MKSRYEKSNQLYEEALSIIPGGVTSARHPKKFMPGYYPIFMDRGKGSHVWDVDGNEYIDFVSSFGPNVLGHGNKRVEDAVIKAIKEGFCFTMVHPIQNELAKKLIDIIPCAEMVKFFTAGSDATSAAVRIARVYTGRDMVIRWGYHGWHDWCYGGGGTDRKAVGVPEGTAQDVVSFEYNNLDSLKNVFKKYSGQIACVIMQPYESTKEWPEEGFLEGVKEITHENGAVLIFDEIRTGFRMALGGAQEYFGVEPDMATFSKAMANGYPTAVVVGKKKIMEAASQTRLSATFIVNSFPLYASLATIQEIIERDGINYLWDIGKMLSEGLNSIFFEEDVSAQVLGAAPIPYLKFETEGNERNQKLKNQFFINNTKAGILFHPNHCWFLSLAHSEDDIRNTLEISRESIKAAKKEI